MAAAGVRTLLILLIVAAMAKPFLESFGNVIAGRRTHRVLVLDGSLSMGYTTGDTSRFDQAKAVAQQFVKDSRRGDAISLIMMGEPPRVVIGDPSPNLAEVQKEIARAFAVRTAATDLAGHLRGDRPGARRLARSRQKEIIFLTDLQAHKLAAGRGVGQGFGSTRCWPSSRRGDPGRWSSTWAGPAARTAP